MSDAVELAEVPALFERWLAGRPLAERSRREYARNVRAFWLGAANLLITRLKNATPQSPLAAALAEYGRIVRTNFVLGDCADPTQRARIAGQLNKGESLHAMRRHLVIGSRAQIPADEDDHRRHALCPQLLGVAVMALVPQQDAYVQRAVLACQP